MADTTHGVNVDFLNLTPVVLPQTGSVACVIGTSTAGSKTAAFHVPVAVSSLTAAVAAFGTAGTVITAARRFFATSRGWFVGILYDASKSGAALTSDQESAIDAVAMAAQTGHYPNVVWAPGLFRNSDNDGGENALLTRLDPIAERQKMFWVADTDNASIAVAKTYADANKSLGGCLIYQRATAGGVTNVDGSTILACEMLANDSRFNIAESPSNREIRPGVTAVNPTVSFSYEDDSLQAGDLGSKGVHSIVRVGQNFYLWGGLTDYASTDARTYVGNARLVLDIRRVEGAFLNAAVDRTGGTGALQLACDSAISSLKVRQANGQLRSGTCSIPADLTAAQIASGNPKLDFDLNLYAPNRRIDTRIRLQISA